MTYPIMSTSPLLLPPRGRDVLGSAPALAAVLGTVLGFGVLGTPLAAAVSLLPALAFVAGGPVLAFAVGTVAVAGVGEIVALPSLPAIVVLTGMLGVDVVDDGRRAGMLFGAFVAAVVGTYVAVRANEAGLLVTAAVLAGGLVVASYLLHRYELVTLGLVESEGGDG